MKASDLIAQYRREAKDSATQQLNSDSEVIDLFNEAIDEACIRKRLLFDATTEAICSVPVLVDTATYALHESIVTPTKAYLIDSGGEHLDLTIIDRFELDRIRPGWRDDDAGEPKYLLLDEKNVQLVPAPSAAYTLKMEVYRVPIATEKLTVPAGEVDVAPVIATGHHRHLVHYVLAWVYVHDDAELWAPVKASRHEGYFNRYFGLPATADRLRSGMTNRPHRNKTW